MPATRLPMRNQFTGNVKLPYIDLLTLASGSRYQIRSTPINEIPRPIRDCFIRYYSTRTSPRPDSTFEIRILPPAAYGASFNRITSSVWLPREIAICLPSGETANAKTDHWCGTVQSEANLNRGYFPGRTRSLPLPVLNFSTHDSELTRNESFYSESFSKITSSVWLPREIAICLPSGDTAKAKMSPVLKKVNCRGAPPAKGMLQMLSAFSRVSA